MNLPLKKIWLVVSKIFYFHPLPREMIQFVINLTNIFQMGWFNYQLENLSRGRKFVDISLIDF